MDFKFLEFTLDSVKAHLRVEHESDDRLIIGYMAAALRYCENFCGKTFATIPPDIAIGLFFHVALLYENREAEFLDKRMPVIDNFYWPYREAIL